MSEKPTTKELIGALKAIYRWCNNMDHSLGSSDKVRAIRLVAHDYLSRAGIDPWQLSPTTRRVEKQVSSC